MNCVKCNIAIHECSYLDLCEKCYAFDVFQRFPPKAEEIAKLKKGKCKSEFCISSHLCGRCNFIKKYAGSFIKNAPQLRLAY
jgi:hypothetical protein